MLRLLNKDRKKNGLTPLKMQDDLRTVARKHSQDMARKDYFEHVNLEGKSPSDRLQIARITEVTSGENLAKIGGYRNPTHFAEQGLMNSSGHKANILQPLYNVVGIGIVKDLRRIYYFTQSFARREVLFHKKVPKRLRLNKDLKISGEALGSVDGILYQIRLAGQKNPLSQKMIRVQQGKVSFHVEFPHSGIFEIWIFTHPKDEKSYKLCNKFEITVHEGF